MTAELGRLKGLRPDLAWNDCAVLARTRAELVLLRAALQHRGIPVRWAVERKGLPNPFRVREITALLDELYTRRLVAVDPLPLGERLPDTLPWTAGLRDVLHDLAVEAGGSVPTARVLDELASWLFEYRRGHLAGEGVFLGTAHSAKGLEFGHVFILGDWRRRASDDPEAERRLFYVAMTRGREGLWLLHRTDVKHPHLDLVPAECRLNRLMSGLPMLASDVLARRFDTLGLEDLFLSFAGQQPAGHTIHAALAALRPGTPIRFATAGSGIVLRDTNGHTIARLSRQGMERWRPRLSGIERAVVLAIVRRRRDESEGQYRDRLRAEAWEVPVVDVVYRVARSAAMLQTAIYIQ